MDVVISRGQTLRTFAQERLPSGATDAQVDAAVAQVAQANGLAPTAKLTQGQRLVVPDAFAGSVTTSAATHDALARLGAREKINPTVMRAQQSAAPLIGLTPHFTPTT